MNKIAVVWGSTGMDGSYLSELLLSKSYTVIGIKRRTSTNNTQNLVNVLNNPNFSLVEGDIIDPSSVNNIINKYHPNECYNLSAQSHVATSFEQPSYTFDVNAKGPLLVLEAIRNYSPNTKYYQASTSEMFGNNYSSKYIGNEEENMYIDSNSLKDYEHYQDENTPFSANSPYAIAKVAAHNLVKLYRESYGVFACAGILFNHESERRGENFVTRKITKWIANASTDFVCNMWSNDYTKNNNMHYELSLNFQKDYPKLKLGNLDAMRDWGYAPEYVNAMWLMLQQEKPDDYVVCTGETHSIKEFLTEAFTLIGHNWEDWIEIDENLKRPCEVPYLRGRYDKAKRILGWEPKVTFKELVRKMVLGDLNVQG